ncbi:hypothetical protein ACX43S_19255 [Enterobacter cloacae]
MKLIIPRLKLQRVYFLTLLRPATRSIFNQQSYPTTKLNRQPLCCSFFVLAAPRSKLNFYPAKLPDHKTQPATLVLFIFCTCCAPQQARFLTSKVTRLQNSTGNPCAVHFLYLLRPAASSIFNQQSYPTTKLTRQPLRCSFYVLVAPRNKVGF